MVLWSKYSHLEREADLVPLAYSICRKKMYEALREGARGGEERPTPVSLASTLPSPEERLMDEEVRERFRRRIKQLSPRCRELVRLRLLGRSVGESAQTLGLRISTLYVLKHRCLKELMKEPSR